MTLFPLGEIVGGLNIGESASITVPGDKYALNVTNLGGGNLEYTGSQRIPDEKNQIGSLSALGIARAVVGCIDYPCPGCSLTSVNRNKPPAHIVTPLTVFKNAPCSKLQCSKGQLI